MIEAETLEIQRHIDEDDFRHDVMGEQIDYFIEWLPGSLLDLFGIQLNRLNRGGITMYGRIQILKQIVATPAIRCQIGEEGLADEIAEFFSGFSDSSEHGFICGDDLPEVIRGSVAFPVCPECGSPRTGFNYIVRNGERGHGGGFCCHACGKICS